MQSIVLVVKDDAEVRDRAHQIVRELRDAGIRLSNGGDEPDLIA